MRFANGILYVILAELLDNTGENVQYSTAIFCTGLFRGRLRLYRHTEEVSYRPEFFISPPADGYSPIRMWKPILNASMYCLPTFILNLLTKRITQMLNGRVQQMFWRWKIVTNSGSYWHYHVLLLLTRHLEGWSPHLHFERNWDGRVKPVKKQFHTKFMCYRPMQ